MTKRRLLPLAVDKKFKCIVKNPCVVLSKEDGHTWDAYCKHFELYEPPLDDKFPIGWCKRFKPDPDAGYIMAYQIPPCATWGMEPRFDELGDPY